MNKEINCIVCGVKYETCGCSRDLNSFKVITESTNHFKIHLIVNDYYNKVINKKEAKKRLEKCNIVGYENFNEIYMKAISEIIKEDDLPTKEVENISEENTQYQRAKSKKKKTILNE